MKTLRLAFSVIIFVSLLLLPACSKLTDKETSTIMTIQHLLDDIEEAFGQYKPGDIIELLHYNFLHNGRDKKEQGYIWVERSLSYHSLSIENRDIVVKGEFATVYFRMTMRSADDKIVTDEPSKEYGDLSYLIKDDGKWYLYGNGEENRQERI